MGSIVEEIRLALHGVWQKRWIALWTAWGVCLLGWLVVSLLPNAYESKATVFVEAHSMLPEKLGITPDERRRSIDSITQTLTSAENLQQVVRTTDLIQRGGGASEVAATAAALRPGIKITAKQDNLFEISAKSGFGGFSNGQNARTSRDVVQRLVDMIVEGNLTGSKAEADRTLKFLDGQIAQRETQLREAEARRVEFEQKNLGVLPGAGSAGARLDAARMELSQIDSQLAAAQGALAAANSQLAATPATVSAPGMGVGGPAAAQVAQLEARLSEGIARGWTDSHPDMMSLRAQIARARAAAAAEARSGSSYGMSNPAYASLRSMVAERQAQLGALSARKAQLQAEIAQNQNLQFSQPAIAAEYQRLSRDYDVLKEQYDKLLADREEVKLRGSLAGDAQPIEVRVLVPPTVPGAPSAPNRALLLTGVLLLGLAIGAGVAFVLSQMRQGFASANRLEKLSGLPVLGSITLSPSDAARAEKARKLRLFMGGAGALAGAYALLMVVELVQRNMVA